MAGLFLFLLKPYLELTMFFLFFFVHFLNLEPEQLPLSYDLLVFFDFL